MNNINSDSNNNDINNCDGNNSVNSQQIFIPGRFPFPPVPSGRPDRPDFQDQGRPFPPGRPDRPDFPGPDRPDRPGRPGRPDRPDFPGPDRPDRPGRPDRDAPTTPPPNIIPQLPRGLTIPSPGSTDFSIQYEESTRRRDISRQFRNCLYRFTFVWLWDGSAFWFYPTYIGWRTVEGFVWSRRRWYYERINLNSIFFYNCF